MRIWRISNHEDLSGIGGLRAPARWHPQGRLVVYCAPNPATALLETLAHIEAGPESIPKTYKFLEIEVPDSVQSEAIKSEDLPKDWANLMHRTQDIGEQWLRSNRSALLYVPCVLLPETHNILVNPTHPDAKKLSIVNKYNWPIDHRLLTPPSGRSFRRSP